MNKIKKAYYGFMYEVTNLAAWYSIAGYGGNNETFVRFWRISNDYRAKRDAVG